MPDYESIMIIKLACSYCGKAMTWSTACDLGKVCLERQDLPNLMQVLTVRTVLTTLEEVQVIVGTATWD